MVVRGTRKKSQKIKGWIESVRNKNDGDHAGIKRKKKMLKNNLSLKPTKAVLGGLWIN